MKNFNFLLKAALGIALFLVSFNAIAQNDSIVLKNGDRLIGEIKNMDKGVMTIETDYSDSDFTVTWVEIIDVQSSQSFFITLSNGTRINSPINSTGEGSGKVKLIDEGQEMVVDISAIVYIKAVKDNFISRLSASVAAGFNYTKSSNLTQFTMDAAVGYTGETWGVNAAYNSVTSKQDEADDIHRTSGTVGLRYFMKNDWFATASGDFLANEEQKLKLRSTLKTGVGKYLVHNNRLYFATAAGVAWNNEQYTDDAGTNRNSLEGFVTGEVDLFDIGDLNFFSNLTAYPSITEWGRFRTDFTMNMKYDLPLDFFVKLSLTYNYDNRPVEGASTNDYVFQSTLGWDL